MPIAERVADWRETLERIAQEFREGAAAVDPKSAKACELCHLPTLCRIDEAPPRPETDDDDSA